MSIKIKLTDNTVKVEKLSNEALVKALETIGGKAEKNAKKIIKKYDRIDTGRMINSVANAFVPREKAVYIGTNVEYAPYHELGTATIGAIHFLKDAATKHNEQYKRIAEAAYKSST